MEFGDAWMRTVTVITPSGGRHYYFAIPDGARVNTRAGLRPGIDVRGTGACVIAPRSAGTNGVYTWEPGYAPDDLPLAHAPSFLLSPPARLPPRRAAHAQTLIRDEKDNKRENIHSLYPCAPDLLLAGPLDRSALPAIARDEQLACACAQYMGVRAPVKLDALFRCVLRTNDRQPSSALHRGENGVIVYRDFANASGFPALTLPEAYAAQITGTAKRLPPASLALWQVRLLVDSSLVDPAPVNLSPLPRNAPPATIRVYGGIRLIFGCRWRYALAEPAPFSVRFLASWSGVTVNTARRVLALLVDGGYLVKVGETKGAYGNGMGLFLPRAPVNR